MSSDTIQLAKSLEEFSKPLQVLLVEDNKDDASLTSIELIKHGYEVTVVEDGEAGVIYAASRRFEIALVDLVLPRMSGLEAAQILRNTYGISPTFLYSGHNIEHALAQEALKQGFTITPKPFKTANIEWFARKQL